MAEELYPRPAGTALDREPGSPVAGIRRTFVVSLVQDETGELHGIVELVRTGRKERFQDLAGLGTVMAAMLRTVATGGS